MKTVLHHTHLSLTDWFWAIYLIARDKREISATQLSRELEIAYSAVSLIDEGYPRFLKMQVTNLDAESVRVVAR